MEPPPTSREQTNLWPVLGGVRFGLAAIVLFNHWPLSVAMPSLGLVIKLLSPTTAVICFLFISGFSIAHSISRSTRHFYRRRLLRIYPLYVVTVAFAVFVQALPGAEYPNRPLNVAANLLFLDTYLVGPLPADPVVWSLAVEVVCYALAPLFLRAGTRMLASLIAVSALGFAVFPLLRWDYYAWLTHGRPLFLLGWAWLAGFLYYRYRHRTEAGFVMIAGAVILTTLNPSFTERFHPITVVTSLTLLVLGGSIPLWRGLAGALNYLGDLSYPLYLIHPPVMMLCTQTLHWRAPLVLIALPLVASALGLVVDLWLRRPFVALLDYLETLFGYPPAGLQPDAVPTPGAEASKTD